MTGPRRQPRGQLKRREVLQATIRLLAREGPRGVTHRAVAAEADTSLRATTYYFSSREELLAEALRYYAETAIKRFDAIRKPMTLDADTPIEAAADMLASTVVSDVVDDHLGLVAEYELVLEIGRHPELEAAYRGWQDKLESLLAGYAEVLGSLHPARDARIVLATLRGLELEALAQPSKKPDRKELKGLFSALLASLVTDSQSKNHDDTRVCSDKKPRKAPQKKRRERK